MRRTSTKHGPRLDDAMQAETRPLEQGAPAEPRVEEWREHEPLDDGTDEPESSEDRTTALGDDPAQARRELSRHLRLGVFPADRDTLVAEAVSQHAPPAVLAVLRTLPQGESYATVHEVWAALTGYPDPAEAARHEPLANGHD
jgi:hypothetical protein